MNQDRFAIVMVSLYSMAFTPSTVIRLPDGAFQMEGLSDESYFTKRAKEHIQAATWKNAQLNGAQWIMYLFDASGVNALVPVKYAEFGL